MKRFLASLGCVILGGGLMAAGMYFYQHFRAPTPSVAADTCLLDECYRGSVTYPIDELQEQERITLIELSLEQIRLETVLGILKERFGPTVQPFPVAYRLAQRETIQFKGLFDKYNVADPKLPTSGMDEGLATSRRAACTQALDQVRHFQERIYNERNAFTARPDIRRVLQEAAKQSEDIFLPAFEACAKEE